MPTARALALIILDGVPGTAMPPWRPLLLRSRGAVDRRLSETGVTHERALRPCLPPLIAAPLWAGTDDLTATGDLGLVIERAHRSAWC